MNAPVITFLKSKTEPGYRLTFSEELLLPGGIIIKPADIDIPILRTDISAAGQADNTMFLLNGKIPIPCFGHIEWVTITGTITGVPCLPDSYMITGCSAETSLPLMVLAPGVKLIDGIVRVSGCKYHTDVTVTGTVSFVADGIEASGRIDAPIRYHPGLLLHCSLHTLLTQAYISLDDAIRLTSGTIRFNLSSTTESSELHDDQFSDDDELLYQFEELLYLHNMKISGLPTKPITMGVELVPANPSSLLLTIFPARLHCNYIGDATTLFLHGNHYDEPFTINTAGPWSASVSSNIFLQLNAPEDESGKPLLEATAPLSGKFSGDGLRTCNLEISALLSSGILFPKSACPHPLPEQEATLTITGDDKAILKLSIEPIRFAGSCIRMIKSDSSPLRAELHRNGLAISGDLAFTVSKDDSDHMERISHAILNGDCEITSKH